MGLLTYAASRAQDQPVHPSSLVKSYTICYQFMQGLLVQLAGRVTPIEHVGLEQRW
ncbi:hypothetical protein DPMN_040258 [Dreissena polymorpha]|uniref:Uncharacterized protein n=1 Tax=Dreissena polymorpha TaxID=45954 RepID=A0A9D4HV49_DREPO|nr:hypothetical protein DPMN_040258 [Dreissena polymorpha]